MAPTLIVIGLLLLGVAIVAWATRKRPDTPVAPRHEQDVVWNDPITPAAPAPDPALVDDPFAHAPAASASQPEARP